MIVSCWYTMRSIMTDYPIHYFQPGSTYTVSIGYDWRLYRHDIQASMVHARMLARQGIIAQDEGDALVRGLEQLRGEIEAGTFPWRDELEDLHMNIEVRLQELIGGTAARLHTARSRNDQVATAMRLYVRDVIGSTTAKLRRLQGALLDVADAHATTMLPGYTHLQRAQPVLLAHHLLAYVEMFERDAARMAACGDRTNVLPLGSGALAGVPYPIDREYVAQELGFDGLSVNSLDAVSDRDYVVEYLSAAALAMTHCSRFAEELVLWSSQEFGFVRLGGEWLTGSSIMPQKRNPDFAELARGKTGRVYGHLLGLLTVLKGLPLAYNRDLQEDKESLFDTVDTLEATLDAFCGMVGSLQVMEQRMHAAANDASLLATDLADYLVSKGIAFRDAHAAVSKLCEVAAGQGQALNELSLEEYQRYSSAFNSDVFEITALSSILARDVPGGTAPKRVTAALKVARKRWKKATAS
jgi:argininosuccinate lyase